MIVTAHTPYKYVRHDAGYYREWVALRYGATLALASGADKRLRNAMKHVRKLAKLSGLDPFDVHRDIILDFEAGCDEVML
jgi:hypothetical protein